MIVLVRILVAIGMLVAIPAGLRLINVPALVRRWWLVGATPGALSLWLPRGVLATGLAAAYAMSTAVLAAQAARRVRRRRPLAPSEPTTPTTRNPTADAGPQNPTASAAPIPLAALLRPQELAVLTALLAPAVAATALVAERAGYRLFGFRLDILALTVAHFHFAGFAAALIAGLVCRTTEDGRAGRAAALSVPVGTAIVFVGYFTADWVEFAGAIVLTVGMWLIGLLTWRDVRPADRAALMLLGVSAVVLLATMALAVSWSLGEATGWPHPSMTWMAATHGVGNALGFGLCGLLGWNRLREERI